MECQFLSHWSDSTRKNPVASGIRTPDLSARRFERERERGGGGGGAGEKDRQTDRQTDRQRQQANIQTSPKPKPYETVWNPR